MRRVMLLVAAMGVALLLASGAAVAAPIGALKQYKVPTAGSSPEHITRATDGNFWFTESFINDQNASPHNVGRITPAGQVTEFNVCDFCFPTDIVQGSDGILYFTKNDAPLGRITTGGQVLPDAGDLFSFNGNGLDAHGDDIWVTDFNNDSIHRYDIPTGVFTEFPTPAQATPIRWTWRWLQTGSCGSRRASARSDASTRPPGSSLSSTSRASPARSTSRATGLCGLPSGSHHRPWAVSTPTRTT